MLCLTSYFLSMADPAQRDQHCKVAEYQYMKIIKSMASSPLAPQSPTETIMICLFLVIIEAHRNDHMRGLTHLQAAISIYLEEQSSPKGRLMDDTLRKVNERFRDRLTLAAIDRNKVDPIQNLSNTAFLYHGLYQTMHVICRRLWNFSNMTLSEKLRVQHICLELLDEDAEAIFQS